ncbi:MAG: glycosyltransferase family 1 protein [Lachnospiraceae bacterium]|nr:glycosyltransferase family 1 protein [Lachnospiraceae bacterium]
MKQIVIISGNSAYNALNIFADELAEGFAQAGEKCTHLQLSSTNQYYSADEFYQNLHQIAKGTRLDLIISINGIAIDIMEDFPLKDQILAFYVDHPFHHHERLRNNIPDCHSLFVDDTFTKCAAEAYPDCHALGTIHQAGSIPKRQDIPFADRKKRICFFGSYRNLRTQLEAIANTPSEGLITNLIADGLDHPNMTIEQIIIKNISENEHRNISIKETSEFSACINPVENFLRGYYREEILRTLLANGIEIDIYGSGWENLDVPGKENLHCFPSVPYLEMADIMTEYQFTLNVLPWAKAGFHDRLATGMLSGCICITDDSTYIKNEQLAKKGVLVYNLAKEQKIISSIKYYLSHTEEAEREAQKAKAYARKNHTWKNRAEQILSLLHHTDTNNDN